MDAGRLPASRWHHRESLFDALRKTEPEMRNPFAVVGLAVDEGAHDYISKAGQYLKHLTDQSMGGWLPSLDKLPPSPHRLLVAGLEGEAHADVRRHYEFMLPLVQQYVADHGLTEFPPGLWQCVRTVEVNDDYEAQRIRPCVLSEPDIRFGSDVEGILWILGEREPGRARIEYGWDLKPSRWESATHITVMHGTLNGDLAALVYWNRAPEAVFIRTDAERVNNLTKEMHKMPSSARWGQFVRRMKTYCGEAQAIADIGQAIRAAAYEFGIKRGTHQHVLAPTIAEQVMREYKEFVNGIPAFIADYPDAAVNLDSLLVDDDGDAVNLQDVVPDGAPDEIDGLISESAVSDILENLTPAQRHAVFKSMQSLDDGVSLFQSYGGDVRAYDRGRKALKGAGAAVEALHRSLHN